MPVRPPPSPRSERSEIASEDDSEGSLADFIEESEDESAAGDEAAAPDAADPESDDDAAAPAPKPKQRRRIVLESDY